MSYFSANLRHLRKSNKINQQDMAEFLGLSRTAYGDYERGKTEPSITNLNKLADKFSMTLDSLINNNLSIGDVLISEKQRMKILAISVDSKNRDNIELVDTKAEAGYLEGFSNPEYIKNLPKISFPNIPQGTYRGFELRGDSMLPVQSGSIVICKYIERIEEVKDGKTYVVISKDDGVVYKRLVVMDGEYNLLLKSDNEAYKPYTLGFGEVSEIWEYYAHLSFDDSEKKVDYKLDALLSEIKELKSLVNKF